MSLVCTATPPWLGHHHHRVSVGRPLVLPSCSLHHGRNWALSSPQNPVFRTLSALESAPQDTDEDFDEDELDALFDEVGEVVLEDSRTPPNSAEIDDESQSLSLAVALAEAADDMKAAEIKVLHVKPLVYWTRFFVIVTGFSRPQLDAIGKKMRDVAEERFKTTPRGDVKPNSWMLLDFGDVVVHIFNPQERAHYNLEEFYANATSIDLPFKSSAAPRLG